MSLSPNEIEAEARRVLPHLATYQRVLAPIGNGVYALVRRGGKGKRSRVKTSEEAVGALLRLELIAPDKAEGAAAGAGTCFVLSPLGQAFLARMGDARNPFGAQHRRMQRSGAAELWGREVDINAAESPLTSLRARKSETGTPFLSEAEYLAGERLRRDFTIALMSPKVTATWPPERTDKSFADASRLDISEAALVAGDRFWSATKAVGPELAPILISVCCHLDGLETIEARHNLPKRSGKTVLKLALQSLARHYGYARRNLAEALQGAVCGDLPKPSGAFGEGG